MANTGPIVVIDDDVEDLEIYKNALTHLKVKNEILLFQSSEESLEYLKSRLDPCFFILCDINMPRMNGLELREELNKDNVLRLKTIPFLFLSNSDHMNHIFRAYNSSVQGYFKKPNDIKKIRDMLKLIISYWSNSLQPAPHLYF